MRGDPGSGGDEGPIGDPVIPSLSHSLTPSSYLHFFFGQTSELVLQ